MMKSTNHFGRRDFLKQMTIAGAGLVAGSAVAQPSQENTQKPTASTHNFYGQHQSGIATPVQKHIYFLVADLDTTDLAEVKAMFQTWTAYSQRLMAGKKVKEYGDNAYIPPEDTGEADDLNPYGLTLTFGVSPSFFEKLNINHAKPQALAPLPHFPRDQLQPNYTGGDLCIQACADDPQVAFHAVRNLVRAARGEITMKWSQAGFNSFEQGNTPRNLFGFKDGTGNPQTEEDLNKTVWIQSNDWLNNGSYLVVRRIKTFLETWDRTNLMGQEETFGRYRQSGAPFGGQKEFDAIDINKKDENGKAIFPDISHVTLAKKAGFSMLRRSFSYASGIDEKGQFDAGLLFISFQENPERFIKVQNMMGNVDKLNEYITHIGSGLFACFAGVKDENDYLGKALFERLKI